MQSNRPLISHPVSDKRLTALVSKDGPLYRSFTVELAICDNGVLTDRDGSYHFSALQLRFSARGRRQHPSIDIPFTPALIVDLDDEVYQFLVDLRGTPRFEDERAALTYGVIAFLCQRLEVTFYLFGPAQIVLKHGNQRSKNHLLPEILEQWLRVE